MTALEVDAARDLAAVEAAWDEIVDAARLPPFARPGWFRAWWDAFGSGELELLTVRRDGMVAGIGPVRRLGGRIATATNYHTPEYAFAAVDREARAQLVEALFDRSRRSVEIAHLLAGGEDHDLVAQAAATRGWTTLEATETSPIVDTTIGWDAYEKQLSSNLRSDVRRRRRRLEEAGEVSVEIETGTERLESLLDEGFGVEGSGWKTAAGTAISSSSATRQFYSDVARWAAQRGWLRLCFLRLDGRPIAFHFDVEADRVLYHLKGGYDPDHAALSPGKVLHHAVLERTFRSDCERYDFLGGNERYKAQFATGARTLSSFRAFAPTTAGRAEDILTRRGRPLAKRIRRFVKART